MRLLIINDSLKPGGKERRLIELIKGLSKYSDIEIHLIIFSDSVHYTEVYDFGIPVTILKRIPKRNPLVFYRFYQVCRKWKPDLIHSWGTMSTIFAIPTTIILRLKLINANIADAPENMGFFDKRLLRARLTFPFSKIIVSNSMAGLRAYGVSNKKGICIYNGFDANRTKNLTNEKAIREQFHIQTEFVIGMVGSFFGNKDYDSYIKAALLVLKEREDVTFLAIGDGDELELHKSMIPNEFASRFIFTGLQKDVESLINVFDIGVLSTFTEGVSNAILEYMALEKPVIASIGGGTVETVDDNITGFLIPQRQPLILAQKIVTLLENKGTARAMGVAGREKLETTFSLNQMTIGFYNLYKTV